MKTSAIRDELVAATEIKMKRGEEDLDFRIRLVAATGELSDEAWEGLSAAAQDWFNDAADALNSKKEPGDFPDMKDDAPAATSRRGSAKTEDAPVAGKRGSVKDKAIDSAPAAAAVGDMVIVTTKRGKVSEGELVEVDADVAVVLVDGEEVEFTRDRVESIVKKESEVAAQATDDAPPYVPAVGDEVIIVTKRGKSIQGEIVEIDGDVLVIDDGTADQEVPRDRIESIVLAAGDGDKSEAPPPYEPALKDVVTIVTKRGKSVEGEIVELDTELIILDVDGKDQEFPRDRIESITPVGKTAPAKATTTAKAEEKPATGRSAAKEVEPEAKKGKVGTKVNDGVSVTTRSKELFLDNPGITLEGLLKLLTKEGLQFREVTITILHKDMSKIMAMMKARNMLK